MRFKVKVATDTGAQKIEINNAPNEQELKKIYSMMGYSVIEILSVEKEIRLIDELSPEQMAKLKATSGVPNMGGGKVQMPSPTPPTPEYRGYTDNGINYRVELNSGVLQKQDWVKLCTDSLKEIAIEEDGKMYSAHSKKLKLFKLEWVDLG